MDTKPHTLHDGDDIFSVSLKNLRIQHSESLTEIADLKTQLYIAQCEISDLKSELKETRAILGEAVVTASKQKAIFEPNAIAGPSKCPETAQKRARSLSVEIIEQPPLQKKASNQSQVSASASRKLHQHSYPSASHSQFNVDKRRRIDLGDPEPEARSEASSSSLGSLSRYKVPTSVAPKKESQRKHEDRVRVPDSIMRTYLSASLPLPIIPPPLLGLQVPRKFLRLAYGGSDQQFLQFIMDTRNPSGPTKRRMVFPMFDMNPAMPDQPGHAGLVFASRHEILRDGPWTVFCKPPETGKALWLYLGEYTSELCGKMTREEFRIQRDAVKKEWAKILLRMKQYDVYVSMRARIALRKAGLLPVDDANEAEKLVKAEMDKVKANKGTVVTEKDIITALNRGDEGIDIIRMTCVKYDHVFANDMKDKFVNYDKMLAADKQKKRSGEPDDNGDDDDDDDDCDDNDDDDDSYVPMRR